MSGTTEVKSESWSRGWQFLFVTQSAVFTAIGCYSTWAQRFLYGDGSYFLLMILNLRRVLDYFPSRRYAHFVTQFPIVYMLRDMGYRDIGVLASVYGATLYLLPLVFLLLAWWSARRAPAFYLVFPLVSSSILFLDTSGFVISESQIAASLYWPLLYLLVFSERLNIIRSAMLIGLAIVATHTYEVYIFLAWPLVFAALYRGWKCWTQSSYWQLLTCVCCLFLFLTAFYVGVSCMLDPNVPADKSGFIEHFLLHLTYPPVWFSLLVLLGTLWCAIGPDLSRVRLAILIVAYACGLFVAILPFLGYVGPWFQYCSRVQTLYVPLLLGSVVLFKTLLMRADTNERAAAKRDLWYFAAGSFIVASVFQFGFTYRWDTYRSYVVHRLVDPLGVVEYEKRLFDSDEFGNSEGEGEGFWNPKLDQFNWGWCMPSLTYMIGALNQGTITTIVCAPQGTGFQPFDPRDPKAIPDLSDFGVKIKLGND